MRAIATDVWSWRGPCVGRTWEPVENGSTKRYAVYESGSRDPQGTMYKMGVGTGWRHLANTTEVSLLGGDASCRYHYRSNLLLLAGASQRVFRGGV